MFFNESKNNLRTRLRSVMERFRPSKSSIEAKTLSKVEMLGLRVVPPVPLPVLTLPSSLSNRLDASRLFDSVMRGSFEQYQRQIEGTAGDHRPLRYAPGSESETLANSASDLLLERQGLLGSPINLNASTMSTVPDENLQSPFISTSIPLKADTTDVVSMCDHSGSIAPEWVDDSTDRATPEFTYVMTTKSQCNCQLDPEEHHLSSTCVASSHSSYGSQYSASTLRCEAPAVFCNPETRSVESPKLKPVRWYLRRTGPVPTPQPLSSKMLETIIAAPRSPPLPRSNSSSPIGFSSFFDRLEQISSGGAPMEMYVLADGDGETDPILVPVRSQPTTEHLPVTRPALRTPGSVSTFMTDVTGFNSNASLSDRQIYPRS